MKSKPKSYKHIKHKTDRNSQRINNNYRTIEQGSKHKRMPPHFVLVLSDFCDLDCYRSYQKSGISTIRKRQPISDEMIENAFTAMKNEMGNNINGGELTLYGEEYLYSKDDYKVKKVLKKAEELNLFVWIGIDENDSKSYVFDPCGKIYSRREDVGTDREIGSYINGKVIMFDK